MSVSFAPPVPAALAEPEPALTSVPEVAVQLAWARGQFDATDLRTTDGERVDILDPGRLNQDSGPDLSLAVVRMGGLVWTGDIEIHRTSADWNAHGHATDPAYDRVVLHVVLSADRTTGSLHRSDGSRLPELVVLPHLSVSLGALLHASATRRTHPPCAGYAPLPTPPATWLPRLGMERLQARANALAARFRARPDLESLLAERVFRALGYHANADAMETLARRVALDELRALGTADAIRQRLVEAAGLSPSPLFAESVPRPMPRESWRRGGRPANAPRHRLAQAASLVAPGGALARGGLDELRASLHRPATALVDWLRRPAVGDAPRLGEARARAVVVNAVLPILLLDGEAREAPAVAERVAELAASLPAPDDTVVRHFAAAGVEAESALGGLGLHALADTLCADGRCAQCAIGQRLAPALFRETG